MSHYTDIAAIDRQVDQVTFQLCIVEDVDTLDAGSWQAAWDKHPDLDAKFRSLFSERGAAQQARDALEYKTRIRKARSARASKPRKCPTCGTHTYALMNHAA